VWCHLLDPILARTCGKVDVLVFNPPYVPSDESEWVFFAFIRATLNNMVHVRLITAQAGRRLDGALSGGISGVGVIQMITRDVPVRLGGPLPLMSHDLTDSLVLGPTLPYRRIVPRGY